MRKSGIMVSIMTVPARVNKLNMRINLSGKTPNTSWKNQSAPDARSMADIGNRKLIGFKNFISMIVCNRNFGSWNEI